MANLSDIDYVETFLFKRNIIYFKHHSKCCFFELEQRRIYEVLWRMSCFSKNQLIIMKNNLKQ
jgi:hypothetical protein